MPLIMTLNEGAETIKGRRRCLAAQPQRREITGETVQASGALMMTRIQPARIRIPYHVVASVGGKKSLQLSCFVLGAAVGGLSHRR